MSKLVEKNKKIFEWGIRLNVNSLDSDTTFYKSFSYGGVQYSQYDCVYMYREGATETDIGKLVKIWWSKKGGKRGKVIWFFRPMDISGYLADYKPSWNELFLASGEGSGVSNIIPLEAIVGKCNVVCTSKDSRNNLPSQSDLEKANYFFSHVFDVGNLQISKMIPDSIGTIKVERLFNCNQDKPKVTGGCRTGLTAGARVKDSPTQSPGKPKLEVPSTDIKTGARDKDEPTQSPEISNLEEPSISEYFEHRTSTAQPLKKRKILVASEADPLPSQDARKWFCKVPWEERVKEAYDNGSLVHLVNLDPSHTSSDVQNIISSAFSLKADAKIIPQGASNSTYGQALVIFNSKYNAEFVMSELKRNCLIVEERPLIARKSSLIEPGKASTFPGHLVMDVSSKIRFDKRKAVNTSHCTQGNTIEHVMALQWRILQKKCDLWWAALHKDQEKEMSYFKSKFIKSHLSGETKAGEEATYASGETKAAEEATSVSGETKVAEEATSVSVSPVDHERTPSKSDQALMECVVNT